MRAMLWIAVSGFLVSGSAYAGTALPMGHDTVRTDGVEAPRVVDATILDQGPLSSAYHLSEMQPEETVRQEQAAPSSYEVTVDPSHPGGLFPWGG